MHLLPDNPKKIAWDAKMEELKQMRLDGHDLRTIAAKLGISYNCARMNAKGIISEKLVTQQEFEKQRREDMVKMHEAGESYRAIARKHAISDKTAAEIVKRVYAKAAKEGKEESFKVRLKLLRNVSVAEQREVSR